MAVTTRFAPSPTGSLHIGGARTAVFNWLYARHHGGRFLLRIEDTDRTRSTRESEMEILESLRWLSLDWDAEPVRQSERMERYRSLAQQLIEEGKAYRCYMTAEELARMRDEARRRGEVFRYRREWASRGAAEGKPYAVRLLTPDEGVIEVHDLLRGVVSFPASEIDDFVILRADGTPTYNFAVVVDDADTGVTHVIRGEDHLSNTPKQLLIYEALGFKPPAFAHVSMILGPDKTKLSKRHGVTSVGVLREEGYLPEAIINYLARLGWSWGDQEIFSREELIEKFSLENVVKSPAIHNPEKLLWLNSWYLRNLPLEQVARRAVPFLEKLGLEPAIDERFLKVVELVRTRAKTLMDIARMSEYFFRPTFAVDEKAWAKFVNPDTKPLLEKVLEKLSTLESFDKDTLQKAYEEVTTETGTKLGKVAQPTRVALTGGPVSPGIFEVIELLGKEETLRRLRRAIDSVEGA